jgi:NAD(P)-dependent dehydrogenase (short-subunit alcohol dehydrogenase family)
VEAAHAAVVGEAGHPEILVNNAGQLQRGGLADLPVQAWNDLLDINLTGYFLCSQIFGRAMLDTGHGTLVHVGSISAKEVIPLGGAYSVSKAAVTMLSTQLAVEWGPRGVRSNIIHPGFVRTPLSQAAYDQPGITEGGRRLFQASASASRKTSPRPCSTWRAPCPHMSMERN